MIALAPRIRQKAAAEKIGISFVIDSLSRAGTEMQLLALIRLLNREEFSPSLVLLDGSGELSRSLEPDCPVLRLATTKLFSRQAWQAAKALNRFWKTHTPQIVQTYFLDSAYFAVPVAKWRGVKRVLRVRNNLGYWLTRKHHVLNRVLRPFVSATLTNSDDGAKQLAKSDRAVVMENGVDLPRLVLTPPIPCSIGCVANLRPVKNIDGLLRACEILKKRGQKFRLEIAGDGPERGNLESVRDTLGLRECVTFHGSVRDVSAFLAKVAISVLPSHSEGMSNALLEAMAGAKAVVATDVGANAKVLGDAGVIVTPRSDDALAEALMSLLNRPEHWESLGRLARRRVEELYSRERMVERFEDYYRSLCRN